VILYLIGKACTAVLSHLHYSIATGSPIPLSGVRFQNVREYKRVMPVCQNRAVLWPERPLYNRPCGRENYRRGHVVFTSNGNANKDESVPTRPVRVYCRGMRPGTTSTATSSRTPLKRGDRHHLHSASCKCGVQIHASSSAPSRQGRT